MDGLDLIASATAYDLEVVRGSASQVGKTPTGVPEAFASLLVDYTVPSGPLKGIGAGAGVRYVGRSFADTANSLVVPEHTLLDAEAHYDLDQWRLAVAATNLADTRFVGTCQSATACFYGEERRVVASLRHSW